MDVSILICTIPSRNDMFVKLYQRLNILKNTADIEVEILYDETLDITIGEKRNRLLARANGKYCCFVDDDDNVGDTYFTTYEHAIKSNIDFDCVKLIGYYFLNGKFIKPFTHSLDYNDWFHDEKGFYRYLNHLNLIKTDICLHIGYKNINFREDADFSRRLFESGLIKTEYNHDNILYMYYKVSSKQPIKKMSMFL